MKRKYFVTVEVRDGERTYIEYFLAQAKVGKETETFNEMIKEMYGYSDEDFDTEDEYFDGFEVIHSLEGWSEISNREWVTLRRWFSDW